MANCYVVVHIINGFYLAWPHYAKICGFYVYICTHNMFCHSTTNAKKMANSFTYVVVHINFGIGQNIVI
jgi:hypothetical protein